MGRKRKRPLPPRTLRMDRAARLQSARSWLTTQSGKPAHRIAKSYRKRFGVDWLGAIAELTALGIAFEAKWREQIACTLADTRRAKARRRAKRSEAAADAGGQESNEQFAFIAGYTEGGAPFGVTWARWEELERGRSSGRPPDVAHRDPAEGEQLPF